MHFAFAGYIRESKFQHQRVKNVYFTEQAISSLLVKLQLNYTQNNKVHMFNSNSPSKLRTGNSTNSYNHGIWGISFISILKFIISNCCTQLPRNKATFSEAHCASSQIQLLACKEIKFRLINPMGKNTRHHLAEFKSYQNTRIYTKKFWIDLISQPHLSLQIYFVILHNA